jgi:site-specific recombinase XerD
MRLGELHQLKCADIRNGSIYLTSSVDARTKSKKWRLIPLSKGAEKALQVFDLKQEYLLPRYRKDSIKTAFKRACKRAGIAKGKHGVHCLRHTFASNLVMNNIALHTVQKLLGHANIKTTEQYAHLSADYLKDSLDGVDF